MVFYDIGRSTEKGSLLNYLAIPYAAKAMPNTANINCRILSNRSPLLIHQLVQTMTNRELSFIPDRPLAKQN